MNDRLEVAPGQWIDRTEPIEFRFEDTRYTGFKGDVLTSALWANGVRLMGRSFKYHRPRSVYSLDGHDANVIVEDSNQTNVRGDLLPLSNGLDVRAVNTSGGLASDLNRWIERFSRFLPVGFYYKAFHTPRKLFPIYERMMRRMAGLGCIKPHEVPAPSPKDYAFCELLVVGSGPSGLSAAIAAAESGVDVILVEQQQRPGGSFHWQHCDQRTQLDNLVERARSLSNLRLHCSTQAAGWFSDNWIPLVSELKLTKLRVKAVVMATGAIEQPAVFQNNDVPGIMLGSAVQRLVHLYAVKPFQKGLVLTANSDGYRVALDLAAAGAEIAGVVDMRPDEDLSPFAQEVAAKGISILNGHTVYEAMSTRSRTCVASATVCAIDHKGQISDASLRTIECDGIAVSVGWVGNSTLLSQTGTRFRYEKNIEQLIPREFPAGVFAAGRLHGFYDLQKRIEDGKFAGLSAAKYLGRDVSLSERPTREEVSPTHSYPIYEHPGKKNFVDFDEDLHLTDIVHAHQEGYDSVELLKRYSTVGMGPSQGKLANMNAVRVLSRLNKEPLEATGTTTARPFYHPVSINLLAGRRFHPHRQTPMDAWHRTHHANMIHVGSWRRPEYYATENQSSDACILDEALNVRHAVGLIDISTLGKYLICGPDAASFLEHVYIGKFAKQNVGTCRYAAACDESGVLIEEGLVARLAEERFYITGTTSGSATFFRELQRWAILLKKDVHLANLTGQWGAMNLAGPTAREVLSKAGNISVYAETFPQNAAREATIADVRAVFVRSGFVGELNYEIHVAASEANKVWLTLMTVGKEYGIRPFGTEAQRLLRLEKGHLILGHDTDALTNPFEVGLEKALKFSKPFFVGKRSLQILQQERLTRTLVGFSFSQDFEGTYPEECQLVIHRGEISGRVTSIARQSTLGHAIGLAHVVPELAKPGQRIEIRTSPGQLVEATVVELPFYDKNNQRQK